MSEDGIGVCMNVCVYGKPLSSLTSLVSCSFDDYSNFEGVCVYVCECVVVYECMECKEERRNSETPLTYTHSHTHPGRGFLW
jgi:hypothetical protein